ncbi:MAG TPA: hypothetical protein VFC93_13645 [Chloroflexota bacterium]|nr:hypothetical protein [Chloroflexota bacterium]
MDHLFDQLVPAQPRPYSAYAPIRQPRRLRREEWPGRPLERAAEVERIGAQLARVAATVPWGRVQDDLWDARSGFVYRLRAEASVRDRAERVAAEHGLDRREFVHYALRRWYCFWGARVAELLFLEHDGVRPGPPRHHEVDFTIDGVPFDLKTTEVPRVFAASIADVSADPGKLASWLYDHQSREGRYHTANRLFLVLCDAEAPDEAWRLRGDVVALRAAIERFMARRRYVELRLPDRYGIERRVLTAVVPVLPARPGRQLRML